MKKDPLTDIPSLEALERKIAAARGPGTGDDATHMRNRAATGLMRLGTEFIAGAGVGGGLGLALDHWLQTGPWFLVIGFLLGFAAGVLNMMRAMSPPPATPHRKDEGAA